jgi:hypothetical protein
MEENVFGPRRQECYWAFLASHTCTFVLWAALPAWFAVDFSVKVFFHRYKKMKEPQMKEDNAFKTVVN